MSLIQFSALANKEIVLSELDISTMPELKQFFDFVIAERDSLALDKSSLFVAYISPYTESKDGLIITICTLFRSLIDTSYKRPNKTTYKRYCMVDGNTFVISDPDALIKLKRKGKLRKFSLCSPFIDDQIPWRFVIKDGKSYRLQYKLEMHH